MNRDRKSLSSFDSKITCTHAHLKRSAACFFFLLQSHIFRLKRGPDQATFVKNRDRSTFFFFGVFVCVLHRKCALTRQNNGNALQEWSTLIADWIYAANVHQKIKDANSNVKINLFPPFFSFKQITRLVLSLALAAATQPCILLFRKVNLYWRKTGENEIMNICA